MAWISKQKHGHDAEVRNNFAVVYYCLLNNKIKT